MGDLARIVRQGGTQQSAPSSGQEVGQPAMSVGGFLENLVGDFKELGQGVGLLGGSVLNDIVNTGRAIVPGGQDPNFLLDDVIKKVGYNWEGKDATEILRDLGTASATGGLATLFNKDFGRAIKDDYSRRYGALLPGGRPAGETGRSLYEDPLSYLLDAADAATLGGTALTKGAVAVSGEGGNVARELRALAEGSDEVGDVSRLTKAVDKIIPGRKLQLAGEDGVPLAGTTKRVTGRGETIDVESSLNPIRRATVDKAREFISTKPIEKFLDELHTNPLDEATQVADAAELRRALNATGEAKVSRIERPFISEARAGGMAKRIIAKMSGGNVQGREMAFEELRNILKPLPPEAAGRFDYLLQGIDLHPNQAGRLDFDQIVGLLSDPQTTRQRTIADAVGSDLERIQSLTDPVEIAAGKRYIEQVAGEPLAAEAKNITDPVGDVMDDVQLWVHRRLTSPKLDKGLPYSKVLDRAYQPMRQAAGATFDRRLGKFVGDGVDPDKAASIYDDAVRNTGAKAPVYFPHEEPLRLRKSDFNTTQRLTGMRKAALDPSVKQSEGILFNRKYFEGQADAYVSNPFEAYSRRAAQVQRQQSVADGIEELVTTLGRKVTARDQLASGEQAINLDAARWMTRSRIGGREEIENALASGADLDEAMFGAAKKTLPTDPNEIQALFDEGASVYAVPKNAARKIDQYQSKMLGNADKYVRLFHDSAMNAWRSGVLYLSPRFYLNNILGNTTFLKLQGGKLIGVLRQFDPEYRAALKEAIGEEAMNEVLGGFFSKTSQRAVHATGKTGELIERVNETKPMRATHWVFDRLRRFNEGIENAYRRESYVTGVEHALETTGLKKQGRAWYRAYDRLNNIAEHGANPSTMRRALDEMNATMNDYRALGPLERNVVKRFVAPFWGFTKHATKTLISMPWKHPMKATLLDKLAEIDGEMKFDLGPIPDWLDEYLPLGHTPEGMASFLSTRGPNPFGGLLDNWGFGQTGPLLQTAYEHLTGRDAFTGRQFTAPDVVTPFGSEQQYKTIRDASGNVIGVEPTKVTPGLGETILSQLPLVPQILEAAEGGKRYTAGGGVIRDESGAPAYPVDWGDQLSKWLGVSTLDYDLGSYQDRRRDEESAALKELLSRLGQ